MAGALLKGSVGAEVRALRQALVTVLGADAADLPGLAAGDSFDTELEVAVRRWQSGVGIIADGVVGPYCQNLLGLASEPELALALGPHEVRPLFPATKPANISRYLPYVRAALGAAGLTDAPMLLAALGTIRAESEGFLPITEMKSVYNTSPGGALFDRYEGRADIGNTRAGDGARFCGRGFVQLTGRANYQRYGAAIGVDLTAAPELANAPEIAAMLLAHFLASHARDMRRALAAKDWKKARRLVNGGSHGLERFTDVFLRAAQVPGWELRGAAARRKAAGAAASAPHTKRRPLTARKDSIDLRDRPYLPPPVSLRAEFPEVDEIREFLPRYVRAGLILDQGQEGACTGFGLACVVNYLRWRRFGVPASLESVSPRMLYNLARRYDEYAGEDYEGSSCRGALKGWFRHGVCVESDWPYRHPEDDPRQPPRRAQPAPKYGYASRATQNSLGVYFRVDLKSITDLQAAIQEVGAVYVSSGVHAGWDEVPNRKRPPRNHADIPDIPFDGTQEETGAHAYALVGYNARGFILQNSWGVEFGAGGFAVISYADWLANAMDAWAVGLGVPGVVVGGTTSLTARGAGRVAGADKSRWWDEAKAYEHSIVTGNDGRVARYLTEDESSRTLMHQVAGLPDQWFRANPGQARKRLVLYAHGGLNSESGAIDRARAMGRYFLGNGCYPLFLVWKTGLLESIGNILREGLRGEAPRAAGLGDWLSDQTDALVEKTIGRGFAKPVWSEMKENAALAAQAGRGGDLLVRALEKLADTWGDDFELHLVGHSAGAILLGHLLDGFAARGLLPRITSAQLYAPACTVEFANRHYASRPEIMRRLHLDVLSQENELADNVAGIYRKSLLYLVSNALETDRRMPLLGLAAVNDPGYTKWDGTSATMATLGAWREAAQAARLKSRTRLVTAGRIVQARKPEKTARASHGGFDNDVDMVGATLRRITGAELAMPVDDLRGF